VELEDYRVKGICLKWNQILTLLKTEINTFTTVIIAVNALGEILIKTSVQGDMRHYVEGCISDTGILLDNISAKN
jgi:hypothetical protein